MVIKKKSLIFIFVLFFISASIYMIYDYNSTKTMHYVSVDDLIHEVYTYENGYDENMKRIISEEAFLKVNSYRFYCYPNFKMPISIDMTFKEHNQKKLDDKIAVYFEYNKIIFDGDGKEVSGELQCPTVAFVVEKEGNLYIEDVRAYENISEVPKEYKTH